MTTADSPHTATPRTPDFYRDVYCILGLPFDAVTPEQAVCKVRMAVQTQTRLFLSTPNLNFLITAQTDTAFRNSVIHSDLSVADGIPIVWLARLLGVPIRQRVAGSSLFQTLMAPAPTSAGLGAHPKPIRVYFFGGPDGVAQAAHTQINSTAPNSTAQPSDLARAGVCSVGYASPGFGTVSDISTPATIAHINASGADFLVVALGAIKGQAWIERNQAKLSTPVLSHLGAVVNFVAGKIDRAPTWVQRVGFEWLWRIKEEPALWRRYLADGKALVRLLVTRVAPLAWLNYTKHPGSKPTAPSSMAMDAQGPWRVVRLHGPWMQTNLDSLRALFTQAAREGWRVRLDLGKVTFVDAAFLGTLMLFADHQANNANAALAVEKSQFAVVNKQFMYSGLGYLLEKNGY